MALQHELESLDGIPETLQSFYSEKEGGGFVVGDEFIQAGIETTETIKPLKNAKHHESELRKQDAEKHQQALREMQDRLKTFEDEAAKKKHDKAMKDGDVESLLKSQEEKFQKIIDELNGELGTSKSTITELVVDSQAKSLASELTVDGSADILYPHIIKRLSMDTDSDGKPKLTVLDAEGKPTVNTIDDLKAEFKNSESFARIIKGSNASGGGADSSKQTGSGASKKKLSDMTVPERAAYKKQLRESQTG
jgi:hypothetical protein